jgi:hypothetical protein
VRITLSPPPPSPESLPARCRRPAEVGGFWETALERELEQLEPDKYYWLPGDPPLTFVKVPEAKTTKNRVHID